MIRKLGLQILGEPLEARYNWCQGPVQGRGPAVDKLWSSGPTKKILLRVVTMGTKQPFSPRLSQLRVGTMGTKQPLSPRLSRSSPQSSTETDSTAYLFIYNRCDIIFTLTASLPQICEVLYLRSQIRKCRVALSHTSTSPFLLLLRINDYPYQLCEQRTCKAMTVN
jgi:hypothetical protein